MVILMNELVQKISTYNIFNYLFPGAIFAYMVETFTKFNLVQKDILMSLFLYYFIGLVISRIGSLIIEPILKRSGFVLHVRYKNYISASKEDDIIKILSEQNNVYRNMLAMIIVIGCVVFYDTIVDFYPVISKYVSFLVLTSLGLLFLFSYRKQTSYIKKRVKSVIKRND